VRGEQAAKTLRRTLRQCTILGVCGLVDFDLAAYIYRQVRRRGHTPRRSATA
jgi:hypothetical protein